MQPGPRKGPRSAQNALAISENGFGRVKANPGGGFRPHCGSQVEFCSTMVWLIDWTVIVQFAVGTPPTMHE